MKVAGSVRALYDDQLGLNKILKDRVDLLLRGNASPNWHYESRLKELVSFALKLESGRVEMPAALEDFFACTLIVRNSTEIALAEKLVTDLFDLKIRRPAVDQLTHKRPDEFTFDDLRLYVKWRDVPDSPPSGLHGVMFEVQVKTFFQHAWAIATHDLIYKTPEPQWGKQRIAFQIRAMLEHAEISIQGAKGLSASAGLAKNNNDALQLTATIAGLRKAWPEADLPRDLRRLAENVNELCRVASVRSDELMLLLDEESAEGRGAQTRNLSPFGALVVTLLRKRKSQVLASLTDKKRRRKWKLLIPAEIDLPEDFEPGSLINAVVLGKSTGVADI